MITKWNLSNFKSVRKETELQFGPLTIFAGANSAGKSSCIQSILMVSQTLTHRISSRSVVLNGTLTRLGQFNDLRSFGSDQNEIIVGWECKPRTTDPGRSSVNLFPLMSLYRSPLRHTVPGMYRGGITSVSSEIAFDASGPRTKPELLQLQPSLESSNLVCVWKGEDGTDIKSTISIKRTTDLKQKQDSIGFSGLPSDADQEALRQSLEFDTIVDQKSLEEVRELLPSAEVVGCELRHFLPGRLCLRLDAVREQARILAHTLVGLGTRAARTGQFAESDIVIPESIVKMLRIALGGSFPLEAKFPEEARVSITLRDWTSTMAEFRPVDRYRIERQLQQDADLQERIIAEYCSNRKHEFVFRYVPITVGLARGVLYLDSVFTNGINYLGPLRDEPKALYPLPPSPDLADVGLRGEYTAAVLDLHKSQYVDYIEPRHFSAPECKRILSPSRLDQAVVDWLRYLGVAEMVDTADRGKLGHELQVRTPGVSTSHDLTHAGVGLSQVLPILVSALLASEDTTLVFEQPELHLHPRVQSRLADFFLSMALLGKQCVIETHSEYLINRLRLRIASSTKEAPLSPMVKIYFVENRENGSTFREVAVNDYGAIPDWPEGFFDESQDQAEQILRAAADKSRVERKTSHDAKRND
jgi:predicted ATPase